MGAVKISKPLQTIINERVTKRTIKIAWLSIPILLGFILNGSIIKAQSVKLLRGNSYEIGLIKSKATFKVPITINAAAKGKLPRVQLVNINYQNPARSVPDSAFAPELLIDAYKNAFLQITINNTPPLDQGKYQLLINVFKVDSLDIEPETINVDITIKAAALYPTATVIATRTSPFPFMEYCSSIKPLSLFEFSRNSVIGPLAIREISLIDAKGTAITGRLKFEDLNKEIPAGEQASFSYELSGNFPIGTVVGSYELTAPQLANPVPFTIQIITKRGGAWIILIIFIGLLFGYFTRVFLETRIQRDKTILDAVELLQLIKQEKYNSPDEKFGNNLDRIYNELKTSVDFRKTDDIITATTTARANLVAQIDAIKKEQADNKIDFENLNKILSISWASLPEQFILIIENARLNLEKISSDNEEYKVTAAKNNFNALRKRMLEDCRTAAGLWKRLMVTCLNDVRTSAFKTQAFYPAFQAALVTSLEEIDKIPADLSDISLDKITIFQNLFQSISQNRSNILNLLYNLTLGTNTLIEEIVKTVTASGVDVANLLAAYETFAHKLNVTDSRSLEDVSTGLGAALQELQDNIIKTLVNDSPKLHDDERIQVKEKLQQGLYMESANMVVEFIKSQEAAVKNVMEGVVIPETAEQLMSNGPPIPYNTIFLENSLELGNLNANSTDKDDIAVEKFYTRVLKNLLLLTIWQTVLIGIGITLIGYTIFVDKFTGTFTDMIEIFSWALVLDITLNSTLTNVAAKVPKKVGA